MSSHKRITDDQVARHMEPVLARLMRHVELGETQPPETQERTQAKAKKPGRRSRPEQPEATQTAALTSDQRDFLRAIVDQPLLTMTGRAEHLGLSAHRCNELKKDGIRQGWIEEVSVNLGKQTGGICKFLELTAAGAKAIGVKHEARPANCSAEHAWFQRRICGWYRRQGFDARTEWHLGNARADIGVRRESGIIAIEVAMTPQHEVANAKRDLAAGFSRVYIACANAQVQRAVVDRLAPALTSEERAQVQVMLLADFSFVKELTR